MAGWSRYAILRMVPQNGESETLDLMLAFTDADGPVRIDESHRPDWDIETDVNRKHRQKPFGFRWRARLTFHIIDMTDQQWVHQIMSRTMEEGEWTFYLSVDAGVTEHEVIATRYGGPDPLGGKTVVGAEYQITFESVELLTEVPLIDPDAVPVPGSTPVFAPPARTLPVASAAYRGRIYNYIQSGIADQTVVCLDDGLGNYAWQIWGMGS